MPRIAKPSVHTISTLKNIDAYPLAVLLRLTKPGDQFFTKLPDRRVTSESHRQGVKVKTRICQLILDQTVHLITLVEVVDEAQS